MVHKVLYGVVLVVLILVAGYVLWFLLQENVPIETVTDAPVITGQVVYQCADSHTIQAVFIEQGPVSEVVPGLPPVSNVSVVLSFDGASNITLPQVISADGVRFANTDESLVFWIKGSGAMVLENDEAVDYINCISIKEDTGDLPQTYLNENQRFTLRYPTGYSLHVLYPSQILSPNTSISRVTFTIPDSVASGTNLSRDSSLSVEHLTGMENCVASDFFPGSINVKSTIVDDGDFTYSIATLIDAGVGNRYEVKIYAIAETNPCLAVRYFIHSTAIENYDPGTVAEFDKDSLLKQFDAIRQSITLDRQIMPTRSLISAVYPLYSDIVWRSEQVGTYADLKGYQVISEPLVNITNIAAVTQPFETHYADLLVSNDWEEDITMAAGGPGAAVIAYKKGDDYIVLQYQSEFGVNNSTEPAQCPCEVTFSIFSGSKQ